LSLVADSEAPVEAAVGSEIPSFRRALLWLASLGAFFYLSYGGANWLASLKPYVPTVVFSWERHVPFLDWTIVPYWSTNAFYAASVFICRTRRELDTHCRRLLTAQIIAVCCFIVFPLRFSWPKPETSGLFGFMFDALGAFDKPFNQAPSLHVALTVILFDLYRRHLPRFTIPLFAAWSGLVIVSTMTTYQHHFVDLPTGALLGFICLWAFPDHGAPPLATMRLTRDTDRRKLAFRYAAGAAILLALTTISMSVAGANPAWLWLLWPVLALAMVALAYAAIGPMLFQKRGNGEVSIAAQILLAPYRLGAFVNSWLWTRRDRRPAMISDDVSIGRFPTKRDLRASDFRSVIDLTAEFAAPSCTKDWRAIPMLDLAAPPPENLVQAADAIEAARTHGPTLVCCALGYGRSVAAVATWLLRTRRCGTVAEAVSLLKMARPRLALSDAQVAAIEKAAHAA
jgi:protein-tyrosine phosphatase